MTGNICIFAVTLKPTTESSTSTETPDTELTSVQSGDFYSRAGLVD